MTTKLIRKLSQRRDDATDVEKRRCEFITRTLRERVHRRVALVARVVEKKSTLPPPLLPLSALFCSLFLQFTVVSFFFHFVLIFSFFLSFSFLSNSLLLFLSLSLSLSLSPSFSLVFLRFCSTFFRGFFLF